MNKIKATFLICVMCISGCSGGSNNPTAATSTSTTLSFGSFTVAQNSIMDYLIPKAYAATFTSATFCLKRLRFKTDDNDVNSPDDNIDFSPGVVTLSATGSTIGAVTLPTGTYRRIEFDMEKNCVGTNTSQPSVAFTNEFGSFSTDDTITMKWRGTFVEDEAAQSITLNISNAINALAALDNPGNNDIKDALEAAGSVGTF